MYSQHKQILVHPGAVTDEIGIAKSAFNGGPLGELVQWSDLVSTLHILGHHLHLSASITDLKMWVRIQNICRTRPEKEQMNTNLKKIRTVHPDQPTVV